MNNEIKPRTVYLLRRTDKEDDGTDIYVGSTSLTLKRRLQNHRHYSKICNSKLYKKMDETGPENWTIEPLLTFPCNKGTICEFGREWIKLVKPDLNVLSPVRENNEKNRESFKEHHFNSLKTKRYYCNVCDIAFGCSSELKRHFKSLKHSCTFMDSLDYVRSPQ